MWMNANLSSFVGGTIPFVKLNLRPEAHSFPRLHFRVTSTDPQFQRFR